MRISDDRYSRDRQRLDIAMQFIRHEARTRTIAVAVPDLGDDKKNRALDELVVDFAARLDRLFTAEFPAAALELEALVGETIELVAQHMPQIEVSGVRQKIGQRKPAWKFVE